MENEDLNDQSKTTPHISLSLFRYEEFPNLNMTATVQQAMTERR